MATKSKSYYGWSVVAAAWLAMFSLFGYRSTFAVLKIPMLQELASYNIGFSESTLTGGYSLMMMIYAVTAFFCGYILDKWGAKPVYAAGAVFGALGFVTTSTIKSVILYYLCFSLLAGLATGMLWVSSTVSIRKWFIGKEYGAKFGLAFMGAPVAQIVMTKIAQWRMAQDPGNAGAWRSAMLILGIVIGILLVASTLLAKKAPEAYGHTSFGELPAPEEDTAGTAPAPSLTLGQIFSTYPIWGTILVFLTSMLAEFLIWSQVVTYWTKGLSWEKGEATNLYIFIGIFGIFTMPLVGKFSDLVVSKSVNEPQGRKRMLIFGPGVGAVACLMLLIMGKSFAIGLICCLMFAIYWAVVPGGSAGYAGSVYGKATFGKVWGLATLVVMGIGPAVGPMIGAWFLEAKNYPGLVYFALASFCASALLASTLPQSVKRPASKAKPTPAIGRPVAH